jgi:hypothetical protein
MPSSPPGLDNFSRVDSDAWEEVDELRARRKELGSPAQRQRTNPQSFSYDQADKNIA